MGVPSIGILLESGILDIPDAASHFGRKYHIGGHSFPVSMLELLKWPSGLEVVGQILERYKKSAETARILTHRLDSVNLQAPVPRPGKIVCLGKNYLDHIKETGSKVPEFPPIFSKFPSCVIGPGDSIPIPKVSKQIDWEVELALVIGLTCKEVTEKEALEFVAGYTIVNDVTARDLQRDDGQWVRGKSLDGFCPMGPCIVTREELGDAGSLKMTTRVNGVLMQNSSTSKMMYGVRKVVSRLSQSFTLEPGDIIATGTPAGVGFARYPPVFLKKGDVVELEIEGIGTLANPVG